MRKVVKYNHIGLVTENFEEIIQFYGDVLDMHVAAKFRAEDEDSRTTLGLPDMSQDIAMLENEDGSVAMEILYYITPTAPNPTRPRDLSINDIGVKHFSVEVDNIQEIYEKLTKKGMSSPEPMQNPDGFTCMILRDPDGNFCEVRQRNK